MPLDPASLGESVGGAQQFLDSARSGGWSVNETAGQAILKAIRQARDETRNIRAKMTTVIQPMKLGTSPDAIVMVEFNKKIATGDAQSFETNLELFDQVLAQAEDAIQVAMGNYQNVEDEARQRFQRAGE